MRRNLTTQLLKQLDNRARGSTLASCVAPGASKASKRQPISPDAMAAKRASFKLQEGDVRGAVRCLTSKETVASLADDTIGILKPKHPPRPSDRRAPPSLSGPAIVVTGDDIKGAIRGFAPGSSGGRDGLKPQHLKDLSALPGGALIDALVDFTNLVLGGGVPAPVRPTFFGATLIPFTKKDGGLRPIAVGLSLRRLVSKAAAKSASYICAPLLAPLQLGVGVRGGAEALVHAARRFLDCKAADRAFVKLDFKNAFNSLRRDSMLEAVAALYPSLLPYALSSYGCPSHLWLGDNVLSSEEGVQQGDPLGPLLFCITMQPLLSGSQCELVTGYLDDVGLGDSVSRLVDRVHVFEREASSLGLVLNHAKCDVVYLAPEHLSTWLGSGLHFSIKTRSDACLLGSLLNHECVDAALDENGAMIKGIEPRLSLLPAHEAFYLLKSCFAVPRLQYLLRTSPAFASPRCQELAATIREILSNILNIRMTDVSWCQASLPVRWGGVGVRDLVSLAPSAFLGSIHATEALVRSILPAPLALEPDVQVQLATSAWQRLSGANPLLGEDAGRQRSWDDLVCSAVFENLTSRSDQVSKARLLASASPNSGSWLHVLPCRNLGLALSDRELRVAVGLRIGAPLVRSHNCVCGSEVDQLAHHGLSCRRSAGRQRRHAQANDVLVRAIRSVDIQAELEPPRLLNEDGKRPDGATLDPWSRGRTLVWDFTCPDTVAPSHVCQSATTVGAAAAQAEQNKRRKYAELASSGDILFMPVAIETLGVWGPSAWELCRDIGSRAAALSGDSRSHAFLVQRLSLAVQRGNAASVAGTHPLSDMSDNGVF